MAQTYSVSECSLSVGNSGPALSILPLILRLKAEMLINTIMRNLVNLFESRGFGSPPDDGLRTRVRNTRRVRG
jgi:hypothetical protein